MTENVRKIAEGIAERREVLDRVAEFGAEWERQERPPLVVRLIRPSPTVHLGEPFEYVDLTATDLGKLLGYAQAQSDAMSNGLDLARFLAEAEEAQE